MLNYISCEKNVNKQRLFSSITGDYTYTVCLNKYINKSPICEQSSFYTKNNNLFSTIKFTYLFTKLYLLNKSFTHYPQYLLIKQLIKEN